MRELRPIVETGYENILLVRLLIEEVRCGAVGALFFKHIMPCRWCAGNARTPICFFVFGSTPRCPCQGCAQPLNFGNRGK